MAVRTDSRDTDVYKLIAEIETCGVFLPLPVIAQTDSPYPSGNMRREKVMNWEYYELPAEYFDFSVVEIFAER